MKSRMKAQKAIRKTYKPKQILRDLEAERMKSYALTRDLNDMHAALKRYGAALEAAGAAIIACQCFGENCVSINGKRWYALAKSTRVLRNGEEMTLRVARID